MTDFHEYGNIKFSLYIMFIGFYIGTTTSPAIKKTCLGIQFTHNISGAELLS